MSSGRTGDAGGDERPVRVVVAEDEAIIRLDLVETLADEGYEVVADTGRGDEVIDLVDRYRPDVAVLDIKMPGMDGIELTHQLATERQAAVVLVTAFSQRDLIDRAREAGAMAYVLKPYKRDELVPAIELALARFREFRALEEQVNDLEERLAVRKLVDRAKGRLMDEHGMAESDAFGWIQRRAMEERRTMKQIADDVLAGRLQP